VQTTNFGMRAPHAALHLQLPMATYMIPAAQGTMGGQMGDEFDCSRQGPVYKKLVRIELERLSPRELVRIGKSAETIFGPERAREAITEAGRRFLDGEDQWDPSTDLVDHVIKVIVAMRCWELGQDPETLERLEQKVSGDRVASSVLEGLLIGVKEEDICKCSEISPEEYRKVLLLLWRMLLDIVGGDHVQ